MACNIYILSCPIGAVGDECTFEIDCCDGQHDDEVSEHAEDNKYE